ncbi:MAG TPA: ROK family transcriptional regulator [Trebonia sp.]|nr:ROK family transcriptional regulator [Trebonia sp.]
MPAPDSNGADGAAPARPGTPSLLRELNDRAALNLLLDGSSLTRAQLSELTGVSKVTVAQMLARLEERGLVAAVGASSGGRGPNAALYSVVPSSAYVAALYVEMGQVRTAVADVTGRVIAEVREDPGSGEGDPVELIRSVVDRVCQLAGVSVSALSAFVIGSPGVVDPVTGDPRLAINLPEWHEGVLSGLRGALHKNVLIENDVNLAAVAEHATGAAAGTGDFVLLWIGVGVGLATMLGGRLHRGVTGAAGEIGWLPVPGAPVTSDVGYPAGGGLQWLAGAGAVRALAAEHGFGGLSGDASAGAAVRAAVAAAGDVSADGRSAERFLGELARRVALGAAAVCTVIDPGLVVIGGEVGLAGGRALADRVAAEVARICPVRPRVVPTAVATDPVLRGALLTAVDQARADLLASVGG